MANNPTFLKDLVDPEVLADSVGYTLNQNLRFSALAQVDDTLVGTPGDTLTFPYFRYIGDAVDLEEGVAMDTDKVTADTTAVKIKEVGKGGGITDTAVQSGYGDPYGETARQLGLSMANKVDNDLLAALQSGTTLSASVAPTLVGLQSALDVFADEDGQTIVLLASPNAASKLRLDAGSTFVNGSELGAQMIINGTYGELLGVQVVRTSKLKGGEAYLVKITPDSPALKLVQKKGVNIEVDRVPAERTTNLYASAMYAPYVFDDSKIIKVAFTGVASIDKPKRRQDKPKVDGSSTNSGTATSGK